MFHMKQWATCYMTAFCFPLTVFHARLSWRAAFLPHVYPLRRFNKSRSVFLSL